MANALPTKNTRNIKYTSRDYNSIVTDLVNYLKQYYNNTVGDFSPSSVQMMLVELNAYVQDNLNFYLDTQYNEIFNPQELKNAIKLLKFFGGKYKAKTAANLTAKLYILVPSVVVSGEVQPDSDYLPIIKKGLIANTQNNLQFVSIEDVDFSDETNREITVYSVDNNGMPLFYVIRKPVQLISGTISTYQYSVGNPQPFLNVQLPFSQNVLEIISVVDSNNNTYYEVEYLAQDTVLLSQPNQDPLSKYTTPLLLNAINVNNRFVVDTDYNGVTSLTFGASNGNISSGIMFPNPARFSVNNLSNNIGSFSFDNNVLLNSGSLGIAPANTVLTITYLQGGGTQYNIDPQELNNIVSSQLVLQKPLSLLDNVKYNNLVNSLSILNDEAGQDGMDSLSIDDIKQLIPIYYNSQRRLVSLTDAQILIYSLPAKFGSVSRCRVDKDPNDSLSIAVWILGLDNQGNFALSSNALKQNLKIYLNQFKLLTDNINIYDGEIINFQLKYTVIIKSGINQYDAIAKINNELITNYFNTKFQMGQPIYISKIVRFIDEIPEVLTLTDLQLMNITGPGYSTTTFNFQLNSLNNIIQCGPNQVFELKYPTTTDIIGTVQIQ